MNSLPIDKLTRICPSIMTTTAADGASERYTQVPTIDVINTLMKQGWNPVNAMETRVRTSEKKGFQKHLIRFQHPDLYLNEEAVETVLVNSHDRSCAFQFYLGIFRIACTNGLIVGDQFKRISVRRKDTHADDIIEASFKIISEAPKVIENVKEMKNITLIEPEQKIFAKTALSLMLDTPYEELHEKSPFTPEQLLQNHRYADNKKDLWTTFNIVQENVLKGGLRGRNPETRKRVRSKPVQSIDRNVKLNQALWILAEKMKELRAN
jgi:hypothetical protein